VTQSEIFPVFANQEEALLRAEAYRRQTGRAFPDTVGVCLQISGVLEAGVTETALNELMRRQAGLCVSIFPNPQVSENDRERRLRVFTRTGIFAPGLYVQRIENCPPLKLRAIDLRCSERAQRDRQIQAVLDEDKTLPFDREKPPLLRALWLRFSDDFHLLIIVADHLICDGWSARLIEREFRKLYGHLLRHSPAEMPEPSCWYADLAKCQSQMLKTSFFEADVVYWREVWSKFGAARLTLEDLPFSLPVRVPAPQDGPAPDAIFESERLMLDSQTSAEIRAAARRHRVTLAAVFLAAFAALLRHYTGKTLLAIWAHLSNRGRTGSESTVGFFTHTHLLGFDLSADPSCRELLSQAYAVFLGAYKHQEMPVSHLWRVLRCHPRVPGGRILFDFNTIELGPQNGSPLSDRATMKQILVPGSTTPRLAPLGLYVTDYKEEISLRSDYLANRFPRTSIQEMLADLRAILVALISSPDLRISGLAQLGLKHSRQRGTTGDAMSEFLVLGSELIPHAPRTNSGKETGREES
jgi:hypothetical protein